MNNKYKVNQAEQNLGTKTGFSQKSRAWFDTMFHLNLIPAVIFSVSDSMVIDVNPAFTNILGYSPGEVIGKTSDDLALFVQPERQKSINETLLHDKKIENVTLDVRDKDGRCISSLFSAGIIQHNGRNAALCILSTVNGHKKIELDLQEHKEQIDLTSDGTGMAVWYVNLTTKQCYLSPNWFEMRGLAVKNHLIT